MVVAPVAEATSAVVEATAAVVEATAAVVEATAAVADITKRRVCSLQPPNKPAPSIRSGFCSCGLIVFVSRLRRGRNSGVPGVLNIMMTGFEAQLQP